LRFAASMPLGRKSSSRRSRHRACLSCPGIHVRRAEAEGASVPEDSAIRGFGIFRGFLGSSVPLSAARLRGKPEGAPGEVCKQERRRSRGTSTAWGGDRDCWLTGQGRRKPKRMRDEKSVVLVTSLPGTRTTTTASPSPTSFSPSTGWVPPEPGSADEALPFIHSGRNNATGRTTGEAAARRAEDTPARVRIAEVFCLLWSHLVTAIW
jgi:hypothetical protein